MFIDVNATACVGCNACIRGCPVMGANIAKIDGDSVYIFVDNDKCISCGTCVKTCSHGARTYSDDVERFFEDLRNGVSITMVVAPAFRLTEAEADNYLISLRNMGVKTIYDVGFGADICTYVHVRAIQKKMVGKVISQPCAAVTEYILRHKPEALKYLSPVHSPISCMATYIKKTVGDTNKIACLSPCVAKKQEFRETSLVDYNITYKEVIEYMTNNNLVTRSADTFNWDSLPAYSGKVYPKPGGLKDCLEAMMPKLTVVTSEGVPEVYESLDVYLKTPDNQKPDVFDVLSCREGCIEGPGTRFDHERSLIYRSRVNTVKSASFNKADLKKQFKYFDKHIKIEDYLRVYEPTPVKNADVAKKTEEGFAKLGKTTAESKKFNCGACGYKTCAEMAYAVGCGFDFPNTCHQYVLDCVERDKAEAQQARDNAISMQEDTMRVAGVLTKGVETTTTDVSVVVDKCEDVNKHVKVMLENIEQIKAACDTVINSLDGIESVNKKYREMTDTINDIMEQTHILSLNASIEAARAGEFGKSFAVVANEIRSLAATTKQATSTMSQNDQDISNDVETVKNVATDIVAQLQNLISNVSVLEGDTSDIINVGASINETVTELAETAKTMKGVEGV